MALNLLNNYFNQDLTKYIIEIIKGDLEDELENIYVMSQCMENEKCFIETKKEMKEFKDKLRKLEAEYCRIAKLINQY